MLKIVAAGVTALFVTASPFAYAQAPSAGALERLSEADLSTLTDARIDIVKAALVEVVKQMRCLDNAAEIGERPSKPGRAVVGL
jgi:hypothetical protein